MSSTSVFEAAAAGDIEYLKSHSSELSTKNDRGWTPLHFAARYGQLEVVTYLVDKKVPTEITNSEGKTAYALAEFWGFDTVAKALQPAADSTSGKQDTAPVKHKFTPNTINYFAGSPLNRFSWFRSDKATLDRLIKSQTSRFVLLSDLKPLIDDSQEQSQLYYGTWSEVENLVGDPYGQKEDLTDVDTPALVFLGIDESDGIAENGIAYWALDVTPVGPRKVQFEQLHQNLEKRDILFYDPRPKAFVLDKSSAAIFAQARSMIDWNRRNQYCPACGRRTISAEAGHKRICPPQTGPPGDSPCISSKGVHNFAYPRTDPVIIVCVIHPTEDKILLGRQTVWPKRQYSCLAGFVEAGESVEEAVRREVREESGVVVSNVVFHSSQPWPFPNSLMMGFIAQAASTEIKLEDKELEHAAWYSRGEVLAALSGQSGAPFNLPPGIAIAHQLVKSWATEVEWGGNGLNAKM